MLRGNFANAMLRYELVHERTGGFTHVAEDSDTTTIYEGRRALSGARHAVVVAGREYGTGSSRDWAAKGTRLLGVRAVLTYVLSTLAGKDAA